MTNTHGRARPDFWSYFNCADEVAGGLTLDELDADFVADAERTAAHYAFPWPPCMATAEEYALDHPEAVR